MKPVEIPARCLGVVIPVYNEEKTLHIIVEKVLARPEVGELVIVNDCSKDGTWQTMQELAKTDPRIRIFTHEVNQGKGAALRTGFQHVSSDIIIIQDADLEYDPDEYPKLLMPIIMGSKLHWLVESSIVQTNVVAHTGANGFSRLARQAEFDGSVSKHACYVLVDDFVGQGGRSRTYADFCSTTAHKSLGEPY